MQMHCTFPSHSRYVPVYLPVVIIKGCSPDPLARASYCILEDSRNFNQAKLISAIHFY